MNRTRTNLTCILRLSLLAAAILVSVLINAHSAVAATYDVNLSFSQFSNTASVVGTVDLPLGNYTIMNGAPSPFTAINLTLTVNGTPFSLVQTETSFISGTAQFLINANPSTLIFDTANFDGQNPADLEIRDVFGDLYIIGSDVTPHFEEADTTAGIVENTNITFPTQFGIAVPEPSSLVLFSLAAAGAFLMVRRR